jgi:hypothetical protein
MEAFPFGSARVPWFQSHVPLGAPIDHEGHEGWLCFLSFVSFVVKNRGEHDLLP